ncbi:TetR/AcrR family transcriptional regulator [Parafrankia sp. FMc6]|uniref:TetR/AcrR family transcriptional regulator n=1 Tax=Parafrankia soli TaxID=2599596 RepID=UPI0034D520AC
MVPESGGAPHATASGQRGDAGTDYRPAERPRRSDAVRNQERLLTAARAVFAELGTNAPLNTIARRAGVGPATLYRNFANREDLIEAVYREDVAGLRRQADELGDRLPPGAALTAWLRQLARHLLARQGVFVLEIEGPPIAPLPRAAPPASPATPLGDAGAGVLARAQRAGSARADITVDDLVAVTAALVSALGPGGGERNSGTPEAQPAAGEKGEISVQHSQDHDTGAYLDRLLSLVANGWQISDRGGHP